jgi:hypothetical protein
MKINLVIYNKISLIKFIKCLPHQYNQSLLKVNQYWHFYQIIYQYLDYLQSSNIFLLNINIFIIFIKKYFFLPFYN